MTYYRVSIILIQITLLLIFIILQKFYHYLLLNPSHYQMTIEKLTVHILQASTYYTQLNSTSIYGCRCKHLNVCIYLTQLTTKRPLKMLSELS